MLISTESSLISHIEQYINLSHCLSAMIGDRTQQGHIRSSTQDNLTLCEDKLKITVIPPSKEVRQTTP